MPFLPAPVVPSVPPHLTLRAALMPRRHHALGGGPFHFRHLASVATYLQPAQHREGIVQPQNSLLTGVRRRNSLCC